MKNKGTRLLVALAILAMAIAVFMIADDSEASIVSTEPTEDPDYTYLVGTYADSLPASGNLGYCIAPSATATIAGDITLTSDLLISSGAELIINSGKTLTVSGPEVWNKGTITNNGTISLTGPTDTPEDVKGFYEPTCLRNDAREIMVECKGLAGLESSPCAVIVNNGTISIGANSFVDNTDKFVNNGTISLSGDSEGKAEFTINPRNMLKDEINESDADVVVPKTIRGVFENNGTVTVSAYGELINFGKILNKEGKTITVEGSEGIYGIISNGSYPSYSSEPRESMDSKSYLSESSDLEYNAVIENYGSIKVNTLGGLENYDIILNYGTIDVAGGDEYEVGVIINHSSWNVRSLVTDADPELDEVAYLARNYTLIDNFEGGKITVSGCLMNYDLIVNHGIIDIVSEIDNNGGIANDIKTGKINGNIVCETPVEGEVPLERSIADAGPGDLLLIIPYYSVAYSGETRFVETVKTGFNDWETTLTFVTSSAEKGDYQYYSDSDYYDIEEFSEVKGLEGDVDSNVGYKYYLLSIPPQNPGTFSILDADSWVGEAIVTKKYGAEPVIGGKLVSGQPVSVIGYYSDVECTQKIDNIDDVNAGTAVYVKIGSEGNDQYAPFTDVKKVTIAKGDYDMSGVIFKDASKKYNRLPQHIEISGKLPVGADGSSPTVSYSGSAKTASDGPTRITATFSTTSQNYNAPRSMTAMLTIIGPDTPASPTYDDTGSSGSSSQSGSDDGGDKVDSVVVACIAAIASAAAIIVAIVFFRAH